MNKDFQMIKRLNKNNINFDYKKSNDYLFYQENKNIYNQKIKSFLDLNDTNIIIQAKINKQIIEDTYAKFKFELEEELKYLTYEEKQHLFNKYLEPIINELTYFEFNNQKIFIPFFNVEVNKMYTDNMLLTDLKQYKHYLNNYQIDKKNEVFFTLEELKKLYGKHIYNSKFTNLELMIENEQSLIFYHSYMKVLYKFNYDLELIDYLRLIDKKNDLVQAINLDELKIISESFNNDNIEELIGSLYQYQFISEKRYLSYLKEIGR